MSDQLVKEFERQRRLVSQLLSMHSALRDRYRMRAKALTLMIMIMSTLALAFAFVADDSRTEFLGLEAKATTWLGALAIVGYSASIFQLIFDWSAAAGEHERAVLRLSELRSSFAGVSPSQVEFPTSARELSVAYFGVTAALPPIPERAFNRLKAAHLRKVELSRMISNSPGVPLSLLKVWLMRRGLGDGDEQ